VGDGVHHRPLVRWVQVLGVGATSFAGAGRTAQQLAREAVAGALADAGLSSHDVGALAVATGGDAEEAAALAVFDDRVRRTFPPVSVSGAAAVHVAWQAVASGARDVVVCVGYERARSTDARTDAVEVLAAAAQRYMTASGATERHFASVTAKNRTQGADNPRALLTTPVDVSAVLESDLLAWPLRRLMVAPLSEGAAAVVLGAGDGHRTRAGVPTLRASIVVRNGEEDAPEATARAARLAYAAAGLGPDDVDCAEIDDRTAAGELVAYEALEFAPEGQGPELVESGFTALGGVLPVNTSGGALAQGDAVGAAGIAQLCELAWQLRGEAGRRQVSDARVALALASSVDEGGRPLVGLTILSRG
jgi:acetyl-CoA acyltransferase